VKTAWHYFQIPYRKTLSPGFKKRLPSVWDCTSIASYDGGGVGWYFPGFLRSEWPSSQVTSDIRNRSCLWGKGVGGSSGMGSSSSLEFLDVPLVDPNI